jgi:hypothetical protein
VNGPCYKEPCDPEDPESDCYKEALDEVSAGKRVVRKIQEGGMLYIEVNGERYTLLGTKVEEQDK